MRDGAREWLDAQPGTYFVDPNTLYVPPVCFQYSAASTCAGTSRESQETSKREVFPPGKPTDILTSCAAIYSESTVFLFCFLCVCVFPFVCRYGNAAYLLLFVESGS